MTHLKIIELCLNEVNVQLRYHGKDFHQVITELSNLTEVSFEYSGEAVRQDPSNFTEQVIERNANLRKINLIQFPTNNDELNPIREKFENEWRFTVSAPYKCEHRNVVDCLIEKIN